MPHEGSDVRLSAIHSALITPDTKTCVFSYHRMLADPCLVEGLK